MVQKDKTRFIKARRRYIQFQFQKLNDMQQQAVMATEGPLLLLAGAGSGKTTVLIHRIANLIRYGCASDTEEIPDYITPEDVDFLDGLALTASESDQARADYLCAVRPAVPWSILAITFTNKAANELKERLSALLGVQSRDVWAMTFHAACCRILRRDIDRLGYSRHFTIYDSSDSERVMKNVIKSMGLDDKTFPAKLVLSAVSREKDQLTTPEQLLQRGESANDFRLISIAKAYREYQRQLKENDAVDFDDIILLTVRLLQEFEEVRLYYQQKFRYVLVDEYQDTNHAQYLLTTLLAGGQKNLCVVGDDDQSIYRFRGATIENILGFEKQYQSSRVIRLEQNYRSTQAILHAANSVISHNIGRKGKTLWTNNASGSPITVYEASDEGGEANFIASQIIAGSRGKRFQDYAILYRTNAQSNALEFAMKRNGIPYRVIGGTRFFDRAEVKDMLAYLCVINNPRDDLRLNRIINNPPRGLGAKTLEMAARQATATGQPLYDIISHPRAFASLEKAEQKLLAFTSLIQSLQELLNTGISLTDFYDEVVLRTGYAAMLKDKPTVENETRLENVYEIKSSIQSYIQNSEDPTLAGFLEEIALYTDIEQYNEGDNAIVMMTIHSAKGLEFPHVFLAGFEDGLFPGVQAIGSRDDMEEERRLCYVAITRAKQTLTISYAHQRMLYGRTTSSIPSRFLGELPEENLVRKGIARSRLASPVQNRPPVPSFHGAYSQESTRPQPLELKRGDMVEHTAFGRGLVLSVLKMGGDALLEIAFDEIGTKKLMARTASPHMKRLS